MLQKAQLWLEISNPKGEKEVKYTMGKHVHSDLTQNESWQRSWLHCGSDLHAHLFSSSKMNDPFVVTRWDGLYVPEPSIFDDLYSFLPTPSRTPSFRPFCRQRCRQTVKETEPRKQRAFGRAHILFQTGMEIRFYHWQISSLFQNPPEFWEGFGCVGDIM